MTQILRKITTYRNWIGKIILWLIGLAIISSTNYGIILRGFLLTDKEVHFNYAEHLYFTSIGLLFIIGGMFLNKFLDKFISKI